MPNNVTIALYYTDLLEDEQENKTKHFDSRGASVEIVSGLHAPYATAGIKMITIIFIKRRIVSLETILSTHARTHTPTHTPTHARTLTPTHTHTHARAHTHTHTHTATKPSELNYRKP